MTLQHSLGWLPQTKFRPPELGSDVLTRPDLVARLQDAVERHPLTLVSAPAGSGKTTLLALWHSSLSLQMRTAWLRLDADDNDPLTLATALTASLDNVEPGISRTLQIWLEAFGASEPRLHVLISLLVNHLAEAERDTRLVLVLDDLHVLLRESVQGALAHFVEHLPAGVRIVAASRYEGPLPLARLRARGQLAEIRLDELRFSGEEAARYIKRSLKLDLNPTDLSMLVSRTEGWAAGLKLSALSLDRRETAQDRSAFITAVARSERHIFDFLADEVLADQPPDIRSFLLQISILPELTEPACRAVTGRDDSASHLATIYRRNLFVTVLPGPEPAYRLHDLFAEFLRSRLARESTFTEVAELHRRAAKAAASPNSAVHHYLAARVWNDAVSVIVEYGQQQLRQGFVQLPEQWLAALPDSLRGEQPWLQLFAAIDMMQRGRMAEAAPLLEALLPVFSSAGDTAGEL